MTALVAMAARPGKFSRGCGRRLIRASVERFFRDLTEFITEKSFASTRELADAIIAFLAARDDNPRCYVWKAKGEDILRKIDAARQALAALQPASNAVSETAH